MKACNIIIALMCFLVLSGCWAPPISYPSIPQMPNWMWSPFGLVGGLIGLALYFLPTIIAAARGKGNLLLILLLNIFLGWTVVGWVVAMILALV